MATGATPGSGLPPWCVKTDRSPITKISGCPAMLMSGSTVTRPARSSVAPARSASTLPSRDARTPAAHSTVCAARCSCRPFIVTVTPLGIDLRHPRARPRAHAQRDQLALRLLRKIRWERGQHARLALHQQDGRLRAD